MGALIFNVRGWGTLYCTVKRLSSISMYLCNSITLQTMMHAMLRIFIWILQEQVSGWSWGGSHFKEHKFQHYEYYFVQSSQFFLWWHPILYFNYVNIYFSNFILFYFNKCTATDHIDCVCVCLFVCMNKNVIQQQQQQQQQRRQQQPHSRLKKLPTF